MSCTRIGPALAGIVLAAAAMVSQAEAQQTVTAQFDIRLGAMQIGRGNFEARISDESYALGVNARVTGVARLVAGGEGAASAQGALARDRTVPESYEINNTAGDITNAIRLVMRGNAIVAERVLPPSIPLPDRVPLHEHHKRGVVDPLSAFVVAVDGRGETASPRACDRTLRIFDGRARYDIRLSFLRTERVRDIETPILVCRAQYTPVAGHRRPPPGEPGAEAYNEMEAWLMPVPGTRALVLYRMQVGTPAGRMVIQASRVAVTPGTQQAAR